MNICRISRAFFPVIDGAAQHVWSLSRAQAARGHTVTLLQPHVAEWSGTPQNLALVRVGVGPFEPLVYSAKSVVALFGLRAARRVAAIHRTRPFDIVHVHGDAVDAAAAGLWTRRIGLPLVMTIHGGLNTGPRYARWAPRMFAAVSQFIVVSATVRAQLIAIGIDAGSISVISSGIDLARFTAAGAGARPAGAALRIISVGRLHPVKGFEYLIRAVRLLRQEHVDVRLTIVGDGPERLRLERERDGDEHIELAGERPPGEIAALLAASDLFVMPSVDIGVQSEGTPTAILEAMAAGLPIVCTDSGGLAELVRHGRHGAVVPQRDPDALAAAITALGADADMRRSIAVHNRAFVHDKDWPAVADTVGAIYARARRLAATA